jgi:hypothetical protein
MNMNGMQNQDQMMLLNAGPGQNQFSNVQTAAGFQNGQVMNGYGNTFLGTGPQNGMGNVGTISNSKKVEQREFAGMGAEAFEKRMEQFEGRLMEKFEHVMQGFGKQLETSHEKLSTDIHDMGKVMERSQTMLEAKVEYVFTTQNKDHENAQAGMQKQLQEMAQALLERASSTYDANSSSVKAMQTSLSEATALLTQINDKQEKQASKITGSLSQLRFGWAQQMTL